MLKLYFYRHGDAGDKSAWKGDDRDRPLSELGRLEIEGVAAHLAEMDFKPDAIVTSPLARAAQTADALAIALGVPATIDERLAPGFDTAGLVALLENHTGERRIVLVGHDPSFSSVIEDLTGARIHLRKGGLARVELSGIEARGTGVLTWLATPRLMGIDADGA